MDFEFDNNYENYQTNQESNALALGEVIVMCLFTYFILFTAGTVYAISDAIINHA